jgi:hypothetical protein
MRKLLIGTVFFLFVYFGGMAKTIEYAIEICEWSRNGCTTSVYQFETEWVMFIVCDGKLAGSFGGDGEWGGLCHGTETSIGDARTGLPSDA